MSDSFGENPFKSLAIGKFPEKKADKTTSPPSAKKRSKRTTHVSSVEDTAGCDAEERALFLLSVGQVLPTEVKQGDNRAAAQPGAGGFLLEEHAVLPAVKKMKKKHTKTDSPIKKSQSTNTAGQDGEQDDTAKNSDASRSGVKDIVDTKATSARNAHKSSPQGAGMAPLAWSATEASEEDSIFMQSVKEVTPLQGRGRDVVPVPEVGTPPPNGQVSLQDFMDGKLEFALSFTEEYLEGHVVGLDQMTVNKLRAGSFSPEAHLDMHGLNAVQAFEALRGFLRGSWYKGLRTVLVVPGRGRNSPDGIGILREKLQSWLTQDPFKRVVLAFCTAQPHDGGAGSVYVLLRKYKKKGHIYWDRTPADSDLY